MTADIRGAWTLEPWGDRLRVIGPNDQQIADIWAPNEEQRANARLIAAAPALYRALKFMVDTYPPDNEAPQMALDALQSARLQEA